MPTLMWVAFWSCWIGAATCWQEAAHPLPVRVKRADLDVIAKKGYYPTATNLSR